MCLAIAHFLGGPFFVAVRFHSIHFNRIEFLNITNFSSAEVERTNINYLIMILLCVVTVAATPKTFSVCFSLFISG